MINNYFIGYNQYDKFINETMTYNTTGNGKIYMEDYVYNGNVINGKFDGNGYILYIKHPNYKSYEGVFKNNMFDGYGILKYSDGDIYKGNFKENKKNGNGKIYNNGKIIFDNIWDNDIIRGIHNYIEYYVNTDIIKVKGILKDSIKIGVWIYYRVNNTIQKINYYDNNIVTNYIVTYSDGTIVKQRIYNLENLENLEKIEFYKHKLISSDIINYDQIKKFSIDTNIIHNILVLFFNEDQKKSKIIEITPTTNIDKVIYFDNDKIIINDNNKSYIYNLNKLYYNGMINDIYLPNGNGILYEDNKIYDGNFINGKITYGKLIKIDDGIKYIYYEGHFNNFLLNGNGIIYSINKIKIYDGNFNCNKKNGSGISYWETTGLKNWEGLWKDDLKHGQGRLYDENGILICVCMYENDDLINII